MTRSTTSHVVRGDDQPLVRLQAGDVMTGDMATVTTTTSVGEALTSMQVMGVHHLPVLGDGRFVGIVHDRLVALALLSAGGSGDALQQPVSTVMTDDVPQVTEGEPLQRVAHLLSGSRCDAVVVLDAQGQLHGIITMLDVVDAVALGRAGRPSVPGAASWPPAARVGAPPVAATGATS